MKLFDSFSGWGKYFLSSIKKVLVGLVRILWAIVVGVISLLVGVGKCVKACLQKKEPARLFACACMALIALYFALSFANERALRVSAEMQRDSLVGIICDAESNNH